MMSGCPLLMNAGQAAVRISSGVRSTTLHLAPFITRSGGSVKKLLYSQTSKFFRQKAGSCTTRLQWAGCPVFFTGLTAAWD